MSAVAIPAPSAVPAPDVLSAEQVLACFRGKLPAQGQSPLYVIGLAFVAIGMILLPLVYLALIALVAWAVVLHLQNDTGMLAGHGRVGLLTLVAYLTPAVVGGVLVLFMVKPLFAKRAKRSVPFPLVEGDQPALFAFIRRICALTGAPAPRVVEVDCQVNASASFRHGFWSIFLPGDLRLTIGLPLAAGMTLRQMGGVLAHEFGHFSQGLGMRLTYLVRSINAWFARVVYERDEWDERLLEWSKAGDWRIMIIFKIARGAVWLTRRILWALMMIGHGISSFMLRQMEFDADTYEARFAGSEVFAETSRRLRELSVGGQAAMHGLEEGFRTRRVPDDFPAFLVGRVEEVPMDVMEKVHGGAADEKTGWFDSHPCDRDRIAAAARLAQGGVFDSEAPASAVFCDFDGLCRAATAHHYAQVLELPMNEVNLVRTAASVAEAKQMSEARNELRETLGDAVMAYLMPVGMHEPVPWGSGDAAALALARGEIAAQRDAAALALKAYAELDDKADGIDLAEALTAANFTYKPETFGLNSATAAAMAAGRAKLSGEKAPHAETVRKFQAAVERALAHGLALRAEENRTRVEGLLRVLGVVTGAAPNVFRAWSLARAMHMLAQNIGGHPDPVTVQRHMEQLASQIEVLLAPQRERFQATEYPYDHARGQVSLWDCLFPTPPSPDSNEMSRAFESAREFMDHLGPLYVRVLGDLCHAAEFRGGEAARD